MGKEITDSFKLALAQLNPVVGDIEGNVRKARAARADGRGARRRPHRLHRALSHRLSARGSGAEAGAATGGARGLRGVRRGHERRGPRDPDRSALGRRTPGLQRHGAARSGPDRCGALQIQSPQLRRVRREAGVCRGRVAGAHRGAWTVARRSRLRGHLERGGLPVARRGRGQAPDRAERIALLVGQAPPAARSGAGARGGDGAPLGLCQPGRRSGRARLRRRLVRAQCRREARRADARLGRGRGRHRLAS